MTRGREYQTLNVSTASPMELVLMLYDEAIRSLDKTEDAFAMGDNPSRIEAINNHLLHAQDVITELAISLDMDKGGDISKELQRLYDFMINHLSQANIKKELKPVQDVCRMMKELRDAWVEVSKKELAAETPRVSPARLGTIQIAG